MTSFLPDVNMLLALFSQNHRHYETASRWFAEHFSNGWATSCLSELGYIRRFCDKSYSLNPVSPQDALSLLKKAKELANYSFWTEPFNGLTNPEYSAIFAKIKSAAQLNDAYLVATACHNGGKLATLDEKLADTYPQYTILVV